MKPSEQPIYKQEGEIKKSAEDLQQAIQLLKETAERLRTLYDEADTALAKKDIKGYNQKLKEKGQLLIDLPDRLSDALEKTNQETKQRILEQVSWFADLAQRALKSEGDPGVLLTRMGDKIKDKNDLEKLIDSLESKE